jgi:iron complex outermembrane recepter protein
MQKPRKKTVVASAIAQMVLISSGAAYAQATASTDPAKKSELEAVVISGQRAAVESAQAIKKNAEEMVDSIVADDIGKLPDRSVIEVLQRIPGMTLDRAMSRDPQHFSVEGNSVSIRGLSFIRSEINGREAFSANGGRTLNFEDVPPELMAGVDVYKNPSASQIEGGLSGLINLRTAMPFDHKGFKGALSWDGTYSTLVGGRPSPSASILLSDRWKTSAGEFGLLVDLARSKSATRADQVKVDPLHAINDLVPNKTVWVPKGAMWRSQDLNRDRQGQYVAAQWKPNEDFNTSLTYFKSAYTIEWSERYMSMQHTSPLTIRVANGVYDANGIFQSGTLSDPSANQNGINFNPAHRLEDRDSSTTDIAWKFQWNISPKLAFRSDLQRITARTDGFASEIATGLRVQKQTLDLSGDLPKLTFDQADLDLLANPGKHYWAYTMDHNDKAKAEMTAWKADLEYAFDHPVLRDVQFGVRLTDRTSVISQELPSYNWQGVTQPWMLGWKLGKLATLDDPRFNPGAGSVGLYTFDNFMGGAVFAPPGIFPTAEYTRNVKSSYDQLHGYHDILCFEQKAAQGWGDCGAAGAYGVPSYERDPATGSDPTSGVSSVTEKSQAFYTQLRFGFEDWKFPVDGNVGIRYVATKSAASGGTVYRPSAFTPPQNGFVTGVPIPDIPNFGKAESFEHSYNNVLPSLNLRMKAAKDLQFRLAYAEAMFRPDFSQLQGYTNLTRDIRSTTNTATGNVNIDLVTLSGEAQGNPYLKPTTSQQVDLSAEWYFAPASSLTFSVFDKKLTDIVVNQSTVVTLSDTAGQPHKFNVSSPVNGASGVARGFELAYQQYYDNVPSWLKGIGVQASYTYVESSRSLYNPITSPYCASGGDTNGAVSNYNLWNNGCDTDGRTFGDLPLQGLSRDTINFSVLYENGPLSARMAYNWRSKYLQEVRNSWGTRFSDGTTTNPAASDVGQTTTYYALPLWGQAYGQLDASLFYKVTKDFTIGVEGQNLTNTIFKQLMQQHVGDIQHATVVTGPRYSVHARYTF